MEQTRTNAKYTHREQAANVIAFAKLSNLTAAQRGALAIAEGGEESRDCQQAKLQVIYDERFLTGS